MELVCHDAGPRWGVGCGTTGGTLGERYRGATLCSNDQRVLVLLPR